MSNTAPVGALDPMKGWRDWFIQSEREWSEALTKLMKDDVSARAIGQQIHAALHQQQMLTQGMASPLAMLNMPTRDDLVGLAERLGRLEDAVARIEAGLVQLRPSLAQQQPTKPPRTRQVAAAAKDTLAATPAPKRSPPRKGRR